MSLLADDELVDVRLEPAAQHAPHHREVNVGADGEYQPYVCVAGLYDVLMFLRDTLTNTLLTEGGDEKLFCPLGQFVFCIFWKGYVNSAPPSRIHDWLMNSLSLINNSR